MKYVRNSDIARLVIVSLLTYPIRNPWSNLLLMVAFVLTSGIWYTGESGFGALFAVICVTASVALHAISAMLDVIVVIYDHKWRVYTISFHDEGTGKFICKKTVCIPPEHVGITHFDVQRMLANQIKRSWINDRRR